MLLATCANSTAFSTQLARVDKSNLRLCQCKLRLQRAPAAAHYASVVLRAFVHSACSMRWPAGARCPPARARSPVRTPWRTRRSGKDPCATNAGAVRERRPARIAAGRPRKRARSGDGRHSLAGDLDIAACADTEVVRWCDTPRGEGGHWALASDMIVAGRGVEGLTLTPARLSR